MPSDIQQPVQLAHGVVEVVLRETVASAERHEVRVARDEEAIFGARAREDLGVRRALHVASRSDADTRAGEDAAPYTTSAASCVVAGRPQVRHLADRPGALCPFAPALPAPYACWMAPPRTIRVFVVDDAALDQLLAEPPVEAPPAFADRYDEAHWPTAAAALVRARGRGVELDELASCALTALVLVAAEESGDEVGALAATTLRAAAGALDVHGLVPRARFGAAVVDVDAVPRTDGHTGAPATDPVVAQAVDLARAMRQDGHAAVIAFVVLDEAAEDNAEDDDRARKDARAALAQIVVDARAAGASDVHLTPGAPPVLRVGGALRRTQAMPLDDATCAALIDAALDGPARRKLDEDGACATCVELDDAGDVAGQRAAGQRAAGRPGPAGAGDVAGQRAGFAEAGNCRVAAFRQRGSLAAVVRPLDEAARSLAAAGLPATLVEAFGDGRRGLVIVAGPAGAGRTSTASSLVAAIGATSLATVEAARELIGPSTVLAETRIATGTDTASVADALPALLASGADTVVIDPADDGAALDIACTLVAAGRLVVVTLHATNARAAVEQVFESLGGSEGRRRAADALAGVVAQRLVPRADGGGVVLVAEVVIIDDDARLALRGGDPDKMVRALEPDGASLESRLAELVRDGVVDKAAALRASSSRQRMKRLLGS